MVFSHAELAQQLRAGILAFPATAFDGEGRLDGTVTSRQIEALADEAPAALVPGGGAGEMFSLNLEEFATLTEIAVAAGRGLPIVMGIGFGVATACDMARAAEKGGADALLLFPPYLMTPDQAGLFDYVSAVCAATGLGVIVYSRNNGVLTLATALRLAEAHANFIGVKDGVGDFEMLLGLRHRASDRLVLINGVPTAEILAPQCFAVGVRSYSSAVFTFLPKAAKRFYLAVERAEQDVVDRFMRDFYLPLIDLRNRRPGYAVSVVKAGLQVVGRSAGKVRAPLHDLAPDEMRSLERLIHTATVLAEA